MDRKPDFYDEMAEAVGRAGGLAPERWPGLAHIFRVIRTDEMKRCATIADRVAQDRGYDEDVRTAATMIRNKILALSVVPPSKELDALLETDS